MTEKEETYGLMCTLLRRLRRQRLPRLLAIKTKLDHGYRVATEDIHYLQESFSEALRTQPLFDRHPEMSDISLRVIGLYREISLAALKNESSQRM